MDPEETERRAFPRSIMNVDAQVRFGADFVGLLRFKNASVEGLFAEGDFSNVASTNGRIRLKGTNRDLNFEVVQANAEGLRVRLLVDDEDIAELTRDSDEYARTVLSVIFPGDALRNLTEEQAMKRRVRGLE